MTASAFSTTPLRYFPLLLLAIAPTTSAHAISFPSCLSASTVLPEPQRVEYLSFDGIPPGLTVPYFRHLMSHVVVKVNGAKVEALSSWMPGGKEWPQGCADNGLTSQCLVSPYAQQAEFQIEKRSDNVVVSCRVQTGYFHYAAVLLGMSMLAFAPYLSTSWLLHYSLGIVLVACIILLYLARRPRTTLAVSGGGVLAFLFKQTLMDRFGFLATWSLVGVAAVSVLIGVIVVYIADPTSNPRLCTVIKRSMQGIGFFLIVFGSTSEVTLAWPPQTYAGLSLAVFLCVAPTSLVTFLPFIIATLFRALWIKIVGLPVRHYYTQEEMHARMVETTAREMEGLRTVLKDDWSRWLSAFSSDRFEDRKHIMSLHNWAFFRDQVPIGPPPPEGEITVDDDGVRHDPADTDTEEDFERWVRQNELEWEAEANGTVRY